jgi:hypothetical protein
MYSSVNYSINALLNAGGFTYKNDRTTPNMNPQHAFVLETLKQILDVDDGKFDGFANLLYDPSLSPPSDGDIEIYNSNIEICGQIAQNISNKIGLTLEGAIGRVLIFDVTPKIIFDTHAQNNTLQNARSNTININTIGTRAYRMGSISYSSHLGHGIKHSNTSKHRTVYLSKSLGNFSDTSQGEVIYAVSWGDGFEPAFLTNY